MTWNDAKRPACVTGPLEKPKIVLDWVDRELSDSRCRQHDIFVFQYLTGSSEWYIGKANTDENDDIKITANSMHEAKLLAEEYLWKQASAICEIFEGK